MVTTAPLHKPKASHRRLIVRAHRDKETGAWWADSDDIPGLVTEAATFDELVDRVMAVVPDLCNANKIAITGGDVVEFRREGGGSGKTERRYAAESGKTAER
jgi:hypothetical protein